MVLSHRFPAATVSVAALVCALAVAPSAGAMDAPSSETLSALRAACDTSDVVRVSTLRNRYTMHRPALDSAGVHHLRSPGRPAIFAIGTIPPDEKRFPWAEVTRLEAGQLEVRRSLLIGMVVGVALGGGLVLTYGPNLTDASDGAMVWAGASLFALSLTGGLLHGISSPTYEVLLNQNPSRR